MVRDARGHRALRARARRLKLFSAGPAAAYEMTAADLPRLQRFFEENPEYHVAVEGAPPGPQAAQHELDALPPPEWPYDKRWLVRFAGDDGDMVGLADLIENLFVGGVWHIGLFMVATRLHGRGTGRELYEALESWMRGRGCAWIRLGVVADNPRAERFWDRCGYREVRRRLAVPIGQKTHDVRVMMKALAGGKLADYLAAVTRDRPNC